MSSGHLLGPEALAQVAETVRRQLSSYQNSLDLRPRWNQGRYMFAAQATSSIPARSGSAPGTGTATIYALDSSSLAEYNSNGETINNLWDHEIASGSYLLVEQDADGHFWAITDETGGTDVEVVYASTFWQTGDHAWGGTVNMSTDTSATVAHNCTLNSQDVQVQKKGRYAVVVTGSAWAEDTDLTTQIEGEVNIAVETGPTSGGTPIGGAQGDFHIPQIPSIPTPDMYGGAYAVNFICGMNTNDYVWVDYLFQPHPSVSNYKLYINGGISIHRIDASSSVGVPFDS